MKPTTFKIKWIKEYMGHCTLIDGFKVSRVRLQSGSHLYFVHWFENIEYAMPHNKMSDKLYSLNAARKLIRRLKQAPEIYHCNLRLRETNRILSVLHGRVS